MIDTHYCVMYLCEHSAKNVFTFYIHRRARTLLYYKIPLICFMKVDIIYCKILGCPLKTCTYFLFPSCMTLFLKRGRNRLKDCELCLK